MRTRLVRWLFPLLALLITAPAAFAQSAPAQGQGYTQAQLDQMLAPIALYPDPLLSQILMAATYPLEVVKAARWSEQHPGLQGDDAVRAVEYEDWDPSVKSLVAFPRVIRMMSDRLDWTQDLGEAFLEQEPYVMDTIQRLRERALAAGNLAQQRRPAGLDGERNHLHRIRQSARGLCPLLRPAAGVRRLVVAGVSAGALGAVAGLRGPPGPFGQHLPR